MADTAGDGGTLTTKAGKVYVARPSRLPYVRKPPAPEVHTRPFFRDPAHTRPTKWSLYRPLIRAMGGAAALAAARIASPPREAYDGFAPLTPLSGTYPHLLASLRARWRTARGWTSMRDTRAFLLAEERFLSTLSASDPVLAKREAALRSSYDAYLARPAPPPPPRPLLTGGYMRPTKFSPPLPRMKPQPRAIAGMFAHRQRKREHRILKLREVFENRRDITAELRMWRTLGIEDEWSSPVSGTREERRDAGWTPPLDAHAARIEEGLNADARRAQAMFPDDVIERVKAARRRRDVWRVNKARKARGLEPIFPPRSEQEEAARAVKRAAREARLAEAAAREAQKKDP
ncbi:hypothetical protein CC85DRAFT_276027 [Cutaneotrichosporon oleaginosum]|uniref:Uncharacterized protein n=1 Tax=Cutaneotrichosporon oleaginosum TaxID=879819 RepID=A0A0J0XK00_9TREE|nr:uncharacterized protein CC85DRAFT_276027 [Cutaneotrichosporon oleaginosum]KLT41411.1 hypothetical protein CC85DRAFT_276027 [Cutaneotrichosporon oleaginosum]TXT12174.1 hypothetical protein COLE_02584 [Cutaneotrichosporon oleaginosum]